MAFVRDGGTPSRQAAGQKINGKKITAKGGTPPPSRQAAWNFFAKNGVFCLKNTVFGPIFNRFFNHGKGGYPPPPHHGKRPAKKLTEKKSRQRGVPPPSRQKAVIGVFEPFPYRIRGEFLHCAPPHSSCLESLRGESELI